MRDISRNTLYNVLGSALPMAVSLFAIPAYLHQIGEARYGVLAIVWLLLGYFGLLDLGLARAAANQIARLHDEAPSCRESVLWTALLVNGSLGIAGGLVLWAIGDVLIDGYFLMPEDLRHEVRAAVPWIAVAVPISIAGGVLSGAVEARGWFLHLNWIQALSAILFQLIPLSFAYLAGPNLAVLVPVAIISRLVFLLPLFAVVVRAVPLTGWSGPRQQWVGPLLNYGGWITVTNTAGQVIQLADQLMIGALLGVKEVARYSIPFNIAWRLTIFPAALVRTLFPEFSKIGAESAAALCSRSVRSAGAAFVVPVLAAIVAIKPFLSAWIGQHFALESGPVASVLLLGIWINALAYAPLALLQAGGRPDVGAKVFLFEGIPFVVTLWVAIDAFGLLGAAWAWTARVLIETAIFIRISRITGPVFDLWPGAAMLLLGWALANYGNITQGWYWAVGLLLTGTSIVWAMRVEPRLVATLAAAFRPAGRADSRV